MKVSLETVKQFINFELPPVDELVARINHQLGGVEDVVDLGEKYRDAKIVKVVECTKHPNADKLSLCQIDAGTGELIQVVCGANNVHSDMWAVWLPPGSTVPSTFDDAEPFVLEARELRGEMSNGMLASARELALGDDHDGIVELTDNDLPEGKELFAGASFAETFDLNDTIIDIENKMFTHRPDCFGQLGVAREISGVFGHKFTSPEWYLKAPEFAVATGLELEVFNDASENVPRFMAVAMKNVEIKPSPLWLQAELVRWGSKPINNVVDITNWIMLYTAQPTHAYDYDKLRGAKIGARMAREGEELTLLNGKTYELDESDIVIADGEGPIGLAGIMGGRNSEVSSETKNIVLEVATFDMYAVRKSAMRHGVFTDALTRFNKGQSPLQNDRVLMKLMEFMHGMAKAKQASNVFDFDIGSISNAVTITEKFINDRLGLALVIDEITSLLKNVEMSADSPDDHDTYCEVYPPFWRTDIELSEDIVEEVGRLYGFDKLPRELPRRSTKPAPKNALREAKQKIRESMRRSGANEVLTYSFVHEKVLNNAEQDVSQAFKLSNALSPDLQYYRLSVLPSLLDKVHMNIKAGHDEFALYEIGKGHNKKYHADDDNGLPGEMKFVDAVYASKNPRDGAAYYYMRRLVQQLCLDHGFGVRLKPIENKLDYPVTAPFDLRRSALVETHDGTFIGMIGELKQTVLKRFKLPKHTAAMTLDLEGLASVMNSPRQTYAPLSRFPSISQDISLSVASTAAYVDVFDIVYGVAQENGSELDIKIEPVTIYQASDDPDSKTISLRITLTSYERTLTDHDATHILESIAQAAKEKIGARLA